MPRPWRADPDGTWWHVMNRGVARRTVQERRRECRYFLSRLARAVRRREIDVLAYALMTTHFHLLVVSRGLLSTAMRRVQAAHARRFNIPRDRPGPLFAGRFRAKAVKSWAYARSVVLYIDDNPVQAGMAVVPEEYPWASAWHYARARRPPWLHTEYVDGLGIDYGRRSKEQSCSRSQRARAALVEARLACRAGKDPLDALMAGSAADLAGWMKQRARLADGSVSLLPIADARGIEELVAQARDRNPERRFKLDRGRRHAVWSHLRIGLLRDLAGLSWAEIGRRVQGSDKTMKAVHQRHARALQEVPAYLSAAREVAAAYLDYLR